MARIDNLNNFLTDVAGAIKNKTGVTSITPANFDTAINNISTGIEVNGAEQDYYVYTGETVKPGDFCEYVDGIGERNASIFGPTPYNDTTNTEVMRRIGNTNKFILTHSGGLTIAELNNGEFTYGTPCSYTSTSQSFGCLLSEKYFLTYYWSSGTSKPRIYAYKINGFTIKEIGSVQYSNSTETAAFMGIRRLTDTTALALTSYAIFVVSVSDSSITMGSTISSPYSSYTKSYATCVVNENLVLYAYSNHSGSTSSRGITAYKVNGTTVTAHSSGSLTAGAYYQPSNHIDGLVKVNDHRCLCWYTTGGAHYFAPVIIKDDLTITILSDQADLFTAAASGSYPGYSAVYTENQYAVLMRVRAEDGLRVIHKITIDDDNVLHLDQYPELLLTEPTILQSTIRTPSLLLYDNNSLLFTAENNTFIHFTLPTVETQIRCVTQDKADGVVKVGGIGGTILGGHAQKCIIYQCPTNN
jgi:hypothetical protein